MADELNNKKMGVRVNTEAETYLAQNYPHKKPVYFDSNEEIYKQLSNKEIDGLIDDSPISFGFANRNSDITIATLIPDTSSQYAIMMNLHNPELKKKIDKVIDKLESSVFLEEKKQQWFNGKTIK